MVPLIHKDLYNYYFSLAGYLSYLYIYHFSSTSYLSLFTGPDGTIGFTKEKWRNKRPKSHLKADAQSFEPKLASPVISRKISADAPAFIPLNFQVTGSFKSNERS